MYPHAGNPSVVTECSRHDLSLGPGTCALLWDFDAVRRRKQANPLLWDTLCVSLSVVLWGEDFSMPRSAFVERSSRGWDLRLAPMLPLPRHDTRQLGEKLWRIG